MSFSIRVFHYLCRKPIRVMNTLDFYLIIPIAIGFVFGLFKGLIKELTSLVAIVLGIYGAKLMAPFASNILIHTFAVSPKTARPMAYFILFVLIGIGMLLLAKMLNKIFESMSLGGLNKLLGGIFGGLKWALIISVLLNIFDAIDSRFSILHLETKEKSIGYKPILKFAPVLWEEANQKIVKPDSEKHEEESQSEYK